MGLTKNMVRKSPDVLMRSGGPDDGSAGDSTVWRGDGCGSTPFLGFAVREGKKNSQIM
jgi:hypothetical protein